MPFSEANGELLKHSYQIAHYFVKILNTIHSLNTVYKTPLLFITKH